ITMPDVFPSPDHRRLIQASGVNSRSESRRLQLLHEERGRRDYSHPNLGSPLGEIARTSTGAVYFARVKTLVCPHCHDYVAADANLARTLRRHAPRGRSVPTK